MTQHDDNTVLEAAVRSVWMGIDRTPPNGEALRHAAELMLVARNNGKAVPRQTDKTVSPLSGPRTDLLPKRTKEYASGSLHTISPLGR
jgi:hypothetical protein